MHEFKPGDKVRLTGEMWGLLDGSPKKGSVVTLADFDAEIGETPGFRHGVGWWDITVEGYEAVLVSDEELSLPRGDYHPNFVQVFLETEEDKHGERDVYSLSAFRETFAFQWGKDSVPEVQPDMWKLGDVTIGGQHDIDLLRLLLDEIEARLIEEESD